MPGFPQTVVLSDTYRKPADFLAELFAIYESNQEAWSHQSSEAWILYFQYNASNLMKQYWNHSYRLSKEELECISSSIQQFQLGESSDGSSLLQRAKTHARKYDDPAYVKAIELFIREEQRHGSHLARFMIQQSIPLLKKHWLDGIFRVLRKLAGLEVAARVLLTAEIIAIPYYSALSESTDAPLLQNICMQILRDETYHLVFQACTLGKICAKRTTLLNRTAHALHKFLMAITIPTVWMGHRKSLSRGGYDFAKFKKESLAILNVLNQIENLVAKSKQH